MFEKFFSVLYQLCFDLSRKPPVALEPLLIKTWTLFSTLFPGGVEYHIDFFFKICERLKHGRI
jgi:hypothetical protein